MWLVLRRKLDIFIFYKKKLYKHVFQHIYVVKNI